MNKHKWIHFQFAHNFFPQYDGNSYELIVYSDENNHFYFFGYAILWCLGYNQPHVSLQSLVHLQNQHKIDLGSGIFLEEQTVRKLITNRLAETNHPNHQAFENWFEDYLRVCKGSSSPKDCPR